MSDKNNLIPPSHFEPDSLNASPSSSNTLLKKESPKSILKTPSDFLIPTGARPFRSADNSPCVASQQPKPHRAKLKSKLSRRSHSASRYVDSGYDWAEPQFIESEEETTDTDEAAYNAIIELKKENKALKNMVSKSKLGQDQTRHDADILNQQVKFIDRLQKDLCDASKQLSDNEHELRQSENICHQLELKNNEQNVLIKKYEDQIKNQNENEIKLISDIASSEQKLILEKNVQLSKCEQYNNQLEAERRKQDINIEKLNHDHKQEVEQIKSDFESREDNWKKEKKELIQFWEEKLKSEADNSNHEMSKSIEKIKQEKVNVDKENQKLQEQILGAENLNQSLNKKIIELENELKSSKDEKESLQQQITCVNQDLINERKVILNLKSYISQIQADDHAKSQWKNDKKIMENNVKDLECQKLELIKSLEVLNVRFESISKIVELQEEAVTANSKAISNSLSENKAGIVTSQWRQKVFELMVQNKSLQILAREESAKNEIIDKELRACLQDSTRQVNISTNQLRNHEAQLELFKHQNQSLETKNVKLVEEITLSEKKLEEQNYSIAALLNNVTVLRDQFTTSYNKNLTKVMEKCLSLDQRLSFANNRLRTVHDLFLRREAKWRVCLENRNKKVKTVSEKKVDNTNLNFEIERLNQEREMLSQQLLEDAKSFEQFMMEAKQSDEHKKFEMEEQKRTISKYDAKVKELESRVDDLVQSLEDLKSDKEILQGQINSLKSLNQKNVDDAVEELKLQYLDEIKEKEDQISTTKRELTKSVVAMRQQERLATRERNRFSEQLELERVTWLDEEKKMKSEIKSLQRDNNLMVTTLRQEGLTSVYKAARAQPIQLHFLSDKTNKIAPSGDGKPTSCVEKPTKLVQFAEDSKSKDEGVDKMLQDLTNLSNKILTEDSD